MPADGDRVTHMVDRRGECHNRDHGTVDSTVDLNATYDGVFRPDWVGVRWDSGDSVRHPPVNIRPCSCAVLAMLEGE